MFGKQSKGRMTSFVECRGADVVWRRSAHQRLNVATLSLGESVSWLAAQEQFHAYLIS